MNSDSEAINQFLAWLLREDEPPGTAPSGDLNDWAGTELPGPASLLIEHLDPLDSEDLSTLVANFSDSNHFSVEEIPLLEPGDISTVQDRFYALLKRRLQAEIEHKPPLFPWETAICDYESDSPEWTSTPVAPPPWITQLQNLQIPVRLPEQVLVQLLNQCQALAQSSLREGQKLVQAVETLFPANPNLNHLAGLVLASPARSASAELTSTIETYEGATEPQQMVLSLLAARQMLDALTLTVPATQPITEREWLTTAGPVRVQAAMAEPGHLRISAHLPCSGSVQFKGTEAQSTVQRLTPGSLKLELTDLPLDQTYPLEVRLSDSEQAPLVFAIRPTAAATL